MKRGLGVLLFAGVLLLGPACLPGWPAPWAGIDETVIEKAADTAGRPAREPFINTDQGDLLLFVFLLAGIGGGFVAGYHYRALFPPKRRDQGTRREKALPGENPDRDCAPDITRNG